MQLFVLNVRSSGCRGQAAARRRRASCSILGFALLISACNTISKITEEQDGPPTEDHTIVISQLRDAVPKVEPRSRYGNPPAYTVAGKRYHVKNSSLGYAEKGIASWYGKKFHAKRTSSGEPYDMFAMTAAHKTLPLPTYAEITNLENGRQAVVKINDRGPFHANRLIDLSYAAAKKLGITDKGTGLVEIKAIDVKHPTTLSKPHKPKRLPQIYLQVGVFAQKANAERLAQKIEQLVQQPVRLKTLDGKPTTQLYRVQIGPLVGVGITDALHDKIKTAGIGDAIAVIE